MPKRTKVFPAAKLVKDLRRIEDQLATWRKEVQAAIRASKTKPARNTTQTEARRPILGGSCPPP